MDMGQAWIDGTPVALAAATEEAARLLGTSRLAVIAGLGTDVAGTRAALRLARQVGGVVDHMQSTALLRDLDVAREAGIMLTTPSQARLRGDVLWLIGPASAGWLESFARPAPDIQGRERRIVWFCPPPEREKLARRDVSMESVGVPLADLPALLAALRARIAGRPIGKVSIAENKVDAVATTLKGARFGVAVWSATELDPLAIEMLCGIVKDLNANTRFTGLPLWPGDNAAGVLQTCGWTAGFPTRTGFGRGYPEHDPWRFDARRLVESGEADCVLWISAYRPASPDWDAKVPTIALTTEGGRFRRSPRVHIAVGRPGVDHDAVDYLAEAATLAPVTATHKSETISVADAISNISARLPAGGR
jgi:formylmethanofuran dehydrogenase subunit B